MSKHEDVTYLLKHESGFYIKSASGFVELTESKEGAKRFNPKEKINSDTWSKFYSDPKYTVVKRTEVTTVEYEEVERIE